MRRKFSLNKEFTIISPFALVLTLNALQLKLKDFSSEQQNLNKSIAKHYSD